MSMDERDRAARQVVADHPEIDIARVFVRVRVYPSRDVYEITDREAVAGLDDFELAALAAKGNLAWGYDVSGDQITIYTD